MSRLQRIVMEDGTEIYIEATDDVLVPSPTNSSGETQRVAKGIPTAEQLTKSFQSIEATIKTYTKYTLNAFRDAAFADVKKVSLEFGVNVSGMGGVPYIASGTAGCNIKVTVECAFEERIVENLPPT